jgi:hypothetical protein
VTGGGGWLGTNHFIQTNFSSAPHNAGLVSDPWTVQQIDQGTVWASLLVRRDNNGSWQGPTQIGFLPNMSINSAGATEGARFILPAAGGNWSFKAGGANAPGTSVDTGVAAVLGGTQLFVLKYVFGTTTNVFAWIFSNPSQVSLGGADLAEGTALASLSFNAISDVRFNNFGVYTDGLADAITFDEIRLGTSFASVTPSAIPEPSTWAAILGGLVVAVAVIRRRRS